MVQPLNERTRKAEFNGKKDKGISQQLGIQVLAKTCWLAPICCVRHGTFGRAGLSRKWVLAKYWQAKS